MKQLPGYLLICLKNGLVIGKGRRINFFAPAALGTEKEMKIKIFSMVKTFFKSSFSL